MAISLQRANTIIDGTLAKAARLGLKPIAVAVLDAGGHLIALQRQDGASLLRPQIACAKASGALGLGLSSRQIGEIANQRPSFISSLGALTGGAVIPAAGGVVIVDDAGIPTGAVGVSGDTPDNDELSALAGIAASHFIPQT